MRSPEHFDFIVVGAGIVGLGVAWHASRLGASVLVLESSSESEGASIRNFGMIWPIGQPAGERRELAYRNRELWIELAEKAEMSLEQCGSLHLAHHGDELALLEEFCAMDAAEMQLLTADETLRRTKCANENGLLGALWSPSECRVDPRVAISAFSQYLQRTGVRIQFSHTVRCIEDNVVACTNGSQWSADRVLVCNGSEFAMLYPDVFQSSGLKRCKLQMMRTGKQPNGFRLGPHLASGLTLRHYESFAACSSHAQLKSRIAESAPELDRYGIHVMASQYSNGEIILGDSHIYGDEITPFRSEEIDNLILREIAKVYKFPNETIDERWTGIYAKHPDRAWLHVRVSDTVEILNGFGGSGMSMSLAVSESILHGTRSGMVVAK